MKSNSAVKKMKEREDTEKINRFKQEEFENIIGKWNRIMSQFSNPVLKTKNPIIEFEVESRDAIHNYLRTGETTDDEMKLCCCIQKMMMTLTCAPILKTEVTVYKIIDADTALKIIDEYEKDSRYQEKSFLTAKLKESDLTSTANASNIILKILVPSGLPVIYLKKFFQASEDDVVFSPELYFEPCSEIYADAETGKKWLNVKVINMNVY